MNSCILNNALSLFRLRSLSKSIKEVEADPHIKSLVLTSSNPSIFSAGLDLAELHNPPRSNLSEFWTCFQQLFLDLYGSRLGCVAALEGTAPAAGCMLAMCCDFRVISPDAKSKIGLNETRLGIVAPPWLSQLLVDTVGHRHAELALSLGSLFSPQQALAIGLVDEVTNDKTQVSERAMQAALNFATIAPHALKESKLQMRGKAIQKMEREREEDLSYAVDLMLRENVQDHIATYIQQLQKRTGK